jgi:hypothetical protein
MKSIGRIPVLGALLLFGTACADLDVVNVNDADAERALQTPRDIESLIAGSYRQWWLGAVAPTSFGTSFSNMAWQHSQWPANFGVVLYSGVPRVSTVNDPSHDFYGNLVVTWNQAFRALAAVAAGLAAIEESSDVQAALGPNDLARARAFGKFVQGLGHGAAALFYDQGFIVDETRAVFDENGFVITQDLVDHTTMMDAALAYFDEAIEIASGQTWEIPSGWMSVGVPANRLAEIAHSTKARYRAAVARSPEERAAVDWNAVIADIERGVATDWTMNVARGASPWTLAMYNQFFGAAWQQLSYQVAGMADQSGTYQQWLGTPPGERLPEVNGQPFLIITPDLRFPQGTTLQEQADNPGRIYDIPVGATGAPSLGNHFQQPGRGTFRWSYYWARTMRDWGAGTLHPAGAGHVAVVSTVEMDLLKAEALYRLAGNQMTAEAAELVNRTRVAAGLDDISDGVNESCVPRLPSGACGDFFEALKWEKRFETLFSPGFYLAPWFFEGRGWGDLYKDTPLHLPAPCGEMQLIPTSCDNYGGIGGDWAAPTSVYAFPHEG